MDDKVLAALIGAAAALLVLLVRDMVAPAFRARRTRIEYSNALLAEVRFNIADLRAFDQFSAGLPEVRAFIEAKGGPPHITDTRHTRVYVEHLERTFVFRPRTIRRLVVFYHRLDKLTTQIEGLLLPSYAEISTDSKYRAVERIVLTARDAQVLGVIAAAALRGELERVSVWEPRTWCLRGVLGRRKRKKPRRLASAFKPGSDLDPAS